LESVAALTSEIPALIVTTAAAVLASARSSKDMIKSCSSSEEFLNSVYFYASAHDADASFFYTTRTNEASATWLLSNRCTIGGELLSNIAIRTHNATSLIEDCLLVVPSCRGIFLLWKTQDDQRCILQDNNVSMIISIAGRSLRSSTNTLKGNFTPQPACNSLANRNALFAMMNTIIIHYALLVVLNRLLSLALAFTASEAQVCHHRN
jgi:hypothetical protein